MSERVAVYSVGADIEYQDVFLFLYANRDESRVLPPLDGSRVGKRWPTPRVVVETEESEPPQPDIWGVAGKLGSHLAMGAGVIERLEPFISVACELLPLRSEGAVGQKLCLLHVLNPLDVYKVIDTAASYEDRVRALERDRELFGDTLTAEQWEAEERDLREGELFPVLYPVFIADQLPSVPTFFAIDRFLGSDLFLLDYEDEDDTLLRRIEQFGMTGLARTMVWASETGPENVNLFGDV